MLQKVWGSWKANQVGGDQNNNYGLSLKEVKDVTLQVFKDNFVTLNEEANKIAFSRVEIFVEAFLEKVINEKQLTNRLNEPAILNSFHNANKQAALGINETTKSLLIESLIRRLKSEDELADIILDETILVLSKVTENQLNIIALVYWLRYTELLTNLLPDIDSYWKTLVDNLSPAFILSKELSTKDIDFLHLEYLGCGKVNFQFGMNDIEKNFTSKYIGLFTNGHTIKELKSILGSTFEKVKEYIIPTKSTYIDHTRNDLFKLNILNGTILEKERLLNFINGTIWDENDIERIKRCIGENPMSSVLIRDKLLTIPHMDEIYELWGNSHLKTFSLSSVGIQIAQLYISSKSDEFPIKLNKLEIQSWIHKINHIHNI